MRKTKTILLLSVLALGTLEPLHAEYLSRGFEVMPTFYQARDERFQGEGVDFGFNLKMAERFTMGGRLEYLVFRGKDAVFPAATAVVVHGNAVLLGVTAFYRVAETAEKTLGANVGLWAGAITSGQVGNQAIPTAVTPMTNPFIEPMAQATYGLGAGKAAQFKVGVGYRFIRGFPAFAAAFGAGTRAIINFDGLDLQFGVGYSF